MLPVAEEEMLSPLAPSSAWGEERVFSFAAGVGLAAIETHQGQNRARGKKPHQGNFSTNRALCVSEIWAKWSGTHQDRSRSRWKTVLGSALDANGNTLSDAQGRRFTWDFENRLVQAINPGVGTTTFKYDPFGRRIEKSGPLGPTNYLYVGANDIEEVDNSGNLLARYTQEPRWYGPLSMLRGSVTSYYEQDGLNSVASLTNSSGALAQSYTYDSYGKITASTGTLTNPFQYTAREFDTETQLNFYRARYYDQSSGRFLSEDPKKFAGGSVDFYDYVGNNPVNMRDPEGQIPIWGWWCGSNRTGGKFAPYDPSKAGQYHKPWGDTDTACMHHDICYYECRRDQPCGKGDRAACMRKCDSILMSAAPYSIMGNTVSWWVWNGNKNPDTGDNAPNCPGCQSSSSPPPPPQKPCHGWGCVDNR